ncbi:UDP-glucose 4-epimerase GalE [Octadecabacter ascidiaceicola]|uniref:UDP-glucose 4-epimerase n=1 Tax=Octadecabacter ascidiaceicola TaxID=1655543 RepID=A0A238JTE8_9RHOB|nr:UDP-glucose 4-epimerase GalE [Octadecabacter ascidiaceicola]SMX33910.1 UDP-glucose 4-epimerase [Octadecabacter ascidiaceicola]
MKTKASICLTGGAGYVGSHACLALAARGIKPLTIDNLSTGSRDAVRWGPLVNLDLRDTERVTEALINYNVDTVLHFAASAYVGESVSDPLKYYDNNVGGMLSLLTACAAAGVKSFVLSSSCATYGIPDNIPVVENEPQRPINPYGMTKLMCEQMLMDVAPLTDMSYGILRYFNVAGADVSGTLRENHDPETHLIPLTLFAAAGWTSALKLFGGDYETPDGSCIRDYVHVSDLVHGHILAFEHLRANGGNLTVNLGSGQGVSNFEIVEMVERVTGRHVPVEIAPRRKGDPPVLVGNTSKARELLGFVPQRSDLATIVADAARSMGLEAAHAISA